MARTTLNRIGTRLGLLGAALGCLGLMACMGESGVGANAGIGSDVVLTGTVGGHASGQHSAGVVTTHEVTAEGAVGPAVDSARVEANGSFEIRTRLRGEKALIVRAVRGGQEWKARVEDRLVAGKAKAVGLLDAGSSVDAEAWLELRKTPEGRAVLAADIRAAVEAYADSLGLEGFQGNLEQRSLLVARVVLMAKARAAARAAAVAAIVVRAHEIRDSANGGDTLPPPRPDLTPCERAAFLVAAMNPDHPDYAMLRARFALHCMEPDTLPPTPTECNEIRARVDGLEPSTPVALGLRLRLAAYCTADAPPPQPLTRCERAAVRLTLMDPDRPSASILRAHFVERCLEPTPPDGEGMDSVMVDAEAGVEVGPDQIAADVRALIRKK